MKTLYLDCGMGAAGDMLTAALLELTEDPAKTVEELNSLGIPGVRFARETAVKCGITGTHMHVYVNEQEEEEFHHHHAHGHHHEDGADHVHTHEHTHSHHHSGMAEIRHLIGHLHVSDSVRAHVAAVYEAIAQAESHVHGEPVEQIHFHEVGTMDAVADVTAVCWLLEKLGVEQVTASAVHVGSGHVHCAHGILPVPAPATAEILKGIPIYGGEIRGELCTPTGAALLKHFVTSYGAMPVMMVEKTGYGMGSKDFSMANCVRALLGETGEAGDSVVELNCNLDDMTAEAIGFAMEQLLCEGALDVFTTPIGMKKCRPGVMLTVLCRTADREKLVRAIFANTTTLGIRECEKRRCTLTRREEKKMTPWGKVGVKISEGYGVSRAKPEYEDMAAIARAQGISLQAVKAAVEE